MSQSGHLFTGLRFTAIIGAWLMVAVSAGGAIGVQTLQDISEFVKIAP